MVLINFRLSSDYDQDKIISFFKEIGYTYRGINNKSIMKDGDYIEAHEFIKQKKKKKGRAHIYIEFGKKYSGTQKYPQMKVYGHFDIIKSVKGKERHFPDSQEGRIMGEVNFIAREISKIEDIKYMEPKDEKCAHYTLEEVNDAKFREVITEDGYVEYDENKYRKSLKKSQYTISLVKQYKFIHVVLVFAKIIQNPTRHILIKSKAKKEFERLKERLKNKK